MEQLLTHGHDLLPRDAIEDLVVHAREDQRARA